MSVNPYKKLNIYNSELIEQYRAGSMYELPPHLYVCQRHTHCMCMRVGRHSPRAVPSRLLPFLA